MYTEKCVRKKENDMIKWKTLNGKLKYLNVVPISLSAN